MERENQAQEYPGLDWVYANAGRLYSFAAHGFKRNGRGALFLDVSTLHDAEINLIYLNEKKSRELIKFQDGLEEISTYNRYNEYVVMLFNSESGDSSIHKISFVPNWASQN